MKISVGGGVKGVGEVEVGDKGLQITGIHLVFKSCITVFVASEMFLVLKYYNSV